MHPLRRAALPVILLACSMSTTRASAKECNVRDFGAKGDGHTLDTSAIQQAIETCAGTGNTVRLPAGTFLTGTIVLKSNMTFALDRGATLLASPDLKNYISARPPDTRLWSLLLVKDATHINIIGPGVLDGNKVTNPDGEEHIRGPMGLFLMHGEDISIRDLTIRDSGNWNVVVKSGTRLTFDNLTIHGGYDGINMEDVKTATISHSHLYAGDDALAGRYWEDVTVSDSELNSPTNGIRLAGRNVLIRDTLISGPAQVPAGASQRRRQESAFEILANGRGDKNLYTTPGPADNMTLAHVKIVNCYSPIYLAQGPGSAYNTYSAGMGKFTLSDVDVEAAGLTPMYVAGTPEQHVGELVLHNVHIHAAGGATQRDAIEDGLSVISIMPSSVLYLRNLDKLTVDGLEVDFARPDLRPAIFADHVASLSLDRLHIARAPRAEPLLEGSAIGKLTLDGGSPPRISADVEKFVVPDGPLYTHRPYTFEADLKPAQSTGLATIHGAAGKHDLSRDVLLATGEQAHLLYFDTRFPVSQTTEFHVGGRSHPITIATLPTSTVFPPGIKAFKNTTGSIEVEPDGIHIRSTSDSTHLERKDEYAAAYDRSALAEHGSVTVLVDNPESHSGWPGHAGIMVRQSIAEPAQSTGYVVLSASPGGVSLDWDSQGHGMLDQHTPYDGYTTWPIWLRLDRAGDRFTAYTSRDGKTWEKLAEAIAPTAAGPLDAGMFTFNTSALFEQFTIKR